MCHAIDYTIIVLIVRTLLTFRTANLDSVCIEWRNIVKTSSILLG